MKNFISKSQRIGELGEDIACKYLMKQGYSILERNYTRKWGEIDIIAEKKDKKYFIEVKSKSVSNLDLVNSDVNNKDSQNRTEDNMHVMKMRRLRRVVETYLINQRIGNNNWQFDLLVVYMDIENRLAKVRVINNVIL